MIWITLTRFSNGQPVSVNANAILYVTADNDQPTRTRIQFSEREFLQVVESRDDVVKQIAAAVQ